MRTKKKPVDYVNNKEFYQAIVEYEERCRVAKENGEEKPRVTEYIGSCFLKIARGYARKPSFSQYSFKEEMIDDGVENCLMYMHNFNSVKYKNPFSYFTQFVHYAFLRRIAKEKKQVYIAMKLMMESGILETQEHDENNYGDARPETNNDYRDSFIRDFEDRRELKEKGRQQRNSLDEIITN